MLFSPIKVGTQEVKNRVFMPPVSTNLADHGYVTDALVDHYTCLLYTSGGGTGQGTAIGWHAAVGQSAAIGWHGGILIAHRVFSISAVSYTHLDVYKRQRWCRWRQGSRWC